MLVSESYVILYCEKNVICNSSIKNICLKKKKKKKNPNSNTFVLKPNLIFIFYF